MAAGPRKNIFTLLEDMDEEQGVFDPNYKPTEAPRAKPTPDRQAPSNPVKVNQASNRGPKPPLEETKENLKPEGRRGAGEKQKAPAKNERKSRTGRKGEPKREGAGDHGWGDVSKEAELEEAADEIVQEEENKDDEQQEQQDQPQDRRRRNRRFEEEEEDNEPVVTLEDFLGKKVFENFLTNDPKRPSEHDALLSFRSSLTDRGGRRGRGRGRGQRRDFAPKEVEEKKEEQPTEEGEPARGRGGRGRGRGNRGGSGRGSGNGRGRGRGGPRYETSKPNAADFNEFPAIG